MDIPKKCKEILSSHKCIVFAYIFGSFAQGNFNDNSDLDIAIYLDGDMDTDDYLDLKMTLTEAFNREIDLVILNKATPLLKFQVYKNHILIFTRDKTLESEFKVKTLFEYNDVKRYLDLSYDKMIAELKLKREKSNG